MKEPMVWDTVVAESGTPCVEAGRVGLVVSVATDGFRVTWQRWACACHGDHPAIDESFAREAWGQTVKLLARKTAC